MLQKLTGREVTRRNLSLAISSLRACNSAQQQAPADASVGRAKQEPFIAQTSQHDFCNLCSRRWVCSHGNLGLCFQCSPLIRANRCARSSDCATFLSSYDRRPFSSAVAEQPLDQASSPENLASEALQRYLTIIQACEILEAHPWGDETANQLQALNVPFTSNTVVRIIRAVSSPTSSLSFFKWLSLKGFEQDVLTYGAMLDVLGEAGSINDMKLLIGDMGVAGLKLDCGLYDRIIHWLVRQGDGHTALSLSERMKEEGFAWSALTYTSLLDLHVKEEKYEDAVTAYLQMVEESVVPTSETLTLLVRCLLEAGKLECAQKIYLSLPNLKMKPTSSMFAYLMSAYTKVGNITMLKILGKEMRDICGRPGEVFRIALNLLQREGKHDEADSFAMEVWPELIVEERNVKAQFLGGFSISNVRDEDKVQDDLEHLPCTDRKVCVAVAELVRLLESEGLSVFQQVKMDWTADAVYKTLRQLKSSDLAWEFFKWVRSSPGYMRDLRNEVSVLRTLVKSSDFPAFKELLSDLQAKSNISLEIFNSLIKECAIAKNARAAMWVYSRINESSLLPDEESFSLLVQAFARSGNPDKASDLCFVMQDVGVKPDVETYTAVIHSLGLAGRSDDAWSVYQRMLAVGLKPDANTYTALLNVMNMVGDTALGIKIFNEMNTNGVPPMEATQGIMARIWEASGNSMESQKLETQRKFLSSKRREDSLRHIYEVLLEGLVEQKRTPSLSSFS